MQLWIEQTLTCNTLKKNIFLYQWKKKRTFSFLCWWWWTLYSCHPSKHLNISTWKYYQSEMKCKRKKKYDFFSICFCKAFKALCDDSIEYRNPWIRVWYKLTFWKSKKTPMIKLMVFAKDVCSEKWAANKREKKMFKSDLIQRGWLWGIICFSLCVCVCITDPFLFLFFFLLQKYAEFHHFDVVLTYAWSFYGCIYGKYVSISVCSSLNNQNDIQRLNLYIRHGEILCKCCFFFLFEKRRKKKWEKKKENTK